MIKNNYSKSTFTHTSAKGIFKSVKKSDHRQNDYSKTVHNGQKISELDDDHRVQNAMEFYTHLASLMDQNSEACCQTIEARAHALSQEEGGVHHAFLKQVQALNYHVARLQELGHDAIVPEQNVHQFVEKASNLMANTDNPTEVATNDDLSEYQDVVKQGHQLTATITQNASISASKGDLKPEAHPSLDAIMMSIFDSLAIVGQQASLNSEKNYANRLQQKITMLQQLVALATPVSNLFAQAKAEANQMNDNANAISPGWDSMFLPKANKPDKAPGYNYSNGDDPVDLATVLRYRNFVNTSSVDKNVNGDPVPEAVSPETEKRTDLPGGFTGYSGVQSIMLRVYFSKTDTGSSEPDNEFIKKYAVQLKKSDGTPLVGAYYMSLDSLTAALKDLGSQLEPYVGANIADQNPNAFSQSSTLEGLQQAIPSIQDTLNSKVSGSAQNVSFIQSNLASYQSSFQSYLSGVLNVANKQFS